MRILNISNPSKLKYLAASYFVLLGLLNLIDTLLSTISYHYSIRDLIILISLSLPMLINKRLFYLAFGLLAAIISLMILIVYLFSRNPIKTDTSIWFFLIGCVVYSLGFLSSLGLVYVGTYTNEKKRFKLI